MIKIRLVRLLTFCFHNSFPWKISVSNEKPVVLRFAYRAKIRQSNDRTIHRGAIIMFTVIIVFITIIISTVFITIIIMVVLVILPVCSVFVIERPVRIVCAGWLRSKSPANPTNVWTTQHVQGIMFVWRDRKSPKIALRLWKTPTLWSFTTRCYSHGNSHGRNSKTLAGCLWNSSSHFYVCR